MGYAPRQPDASIVLGNSHLLRMDMSEAAEYFGVPVPIARRDRKSGAKKRKQHEIEDELVRKFAFEGDSAA